MTGGGTGGHVVPLLALLEYAQGQSDLPPLQLYYLATGRGMEAELAAQVSFTRIHSGKLRRYFSWSNLLSPLAIVLGMVESWSALRRIQPQVVFSTGGYVSVPVVCAAKVLGIPVILHEQTTQFGLANRLMAPLATKVLVSWQSTLEQYPHLQAKWVGNPVRFISSTQTMAQAKHTLGLRVDLPLVFVGGGAQGSHVINQTVLEKLPQWLEQTQMVISTGPNADFTALQAAAHKLPASLQTRILVEEFVGQQLATVYAAADLFVGRSGAGTVSELIVLQKPSLLVPLLKSAGGEQQHNAQLLVVAGGAVVIPQHDLNPTHLLATVSTLLRDMSKLQRMSTQLKVLQKPDASAAIWAEIVVFA